MATKKSTASQQEKVIALVKTSAPILDEKEATEKQIAELQEKVVLLNNKLMTAKQKEFPGGLTMNVVALYKGKYYIVNSYGVGTYLLEVLPIEEADHAA